MVSISSRWLALGLLGLAATACHQRRGTHLSGALTELQGTWLQSIEEGRADTLVYRRNTYRFPLGHERTGFAIGPYGRFTQFDVAPTDGLAGHDGTWTVPDRSHLRIHLTDGTTPDYTLEIISVRKGVLRLRRQ